MSTYRVIIKTNGIGEILSLTEGDLHSQLEVRGYTRKGVARGTDKRLDGLPTFEGLRGPLLDPHGAVHYEKE